jgi:DUF1680 family protein
MQRFRLASGGHLSNQLDPTLRRKADQKNDETAELQEGAGYLVDWPDRAHCRCVLVGL